MPTTTEISSNSKAPPNRILNAICATQWAMHTDDLRVVVEIASREHELDPRAVQALLGRPLDNTRSVTVRDGVAIIPIIGPIFRYSSMFTELSGASSLSSIAEDFNVALNNEKINAILFEVDSPGGEASGISEFANMVREARLHHNKHIWAYISNQGASAAYWIASAADRLYCAPTAMVGSIGTVAVLRKPDPKDKTVEFVSSQSPHKRPNISTEEGKAKVQAIVDALTDVFVSDVARNRNVDTETVLNDFGAGGIKVGHDAVSAGMVDGLSSFERCIAALAQPESRKAAAVAAISAVTADSDDIVQDGSKPIRRRFLGMGLADKYNAIKAFMQSIDSTENEETQVDDQPTAAPEQVATPATAKSESIEEIARLRAENRRLTVERYNAEAVAFVDATITSGQAFPSERERVISMFVQASLDDATLGATENGQSRVQMLRDAYAVRPKHQLTGESLAPALAEMLRQSQPRNGMTQHDERPPTNDEVRELLNKTALGSSVLRAIDSGNGANNR